MFCLYNVAVTNSSFVSFLNLAPVSNCVIIALQLLMLNLFKISWAYSFWCKNTHSLVSLNSIPKKYDKFPRSEISNSYISFDLNPFICASSTPIINKSPIYNHIISRLSLLSLLKYTPCSETHFVKTTPIRKLSVILFQALGACFKPYRALLNLYTFCSCPLILNHGG